MLSRRPRIIAVSKDGADSWLAADPAVFCTGGRLLWSAKTVFLCISCGRAHSGSSSAANGQSDAWETIALSPQKGEIVLPQSEVISNGTVEMMSRVLADACIRRKIRQESIQGEKLASIIMLAFTSGMTNEAELVVLARNLV